MQSKEEKEVEENTEDSKKNILSKRNKLKIFIAIGVVILLLGVISWFFFRGTTEDKVIDTKSEVNHESDKSKSEINSQSEPIFYNLKEFIVNLNKVGGQPSFLKASITLELNNKDNIAKIEARMPIIQDTFQVYLRELRADDLQGSAGIFRLRQELLLRLNKVLYPVKINDILFREILVQ